MVDAPALTPLVSIPIPKFGDIFLFPSILEQLVQVNQTGMIVESHVKPGDLEIIRIRQHQLEQTLKITSAKLLKHPAALTHHFQPCTMRPLCGLFLIIMNANRTAIKPLLIITTFALCPVLIAQHQFLHPPIRVRHRTCNRQGIIKNQILQLPSPIHVHSTPLLAQWG